MVLQAMSSLGNYMRRCLDIYIQPYFIYVYDRARVDRLPTK